MVMAEFLSTRAVVMVSVTGFVLVVVSDAEGPEVEEA